MDITPFINDPKIPSPESEKRSQFLINKRCSNLNKTGSYPVSMTEQGIALKQGF